MAIYTVAVLVALALALHACLRSIRYGGDTMVVPLSNMRQLHLVTQQMAMDGVSTENKSLGWPGDTGGTFSGWAGQIVSGGYLKTNDLNKLLSGPGVTVSPNANPTWDSTAVRLYAVRESSPGNAVFLTSANFTNTATGGERPRKDAKPYGNKGFVVFRKGGDGAVLQSRQAGDTNLIGSSAPLCR